MRIKVISAVIAAVASITAAVAAFSTPPNALSEFKHSVAQGGDKTILVIGDSTGVWPWGLIYRFSLYVAAQYPDRKFNFHWYAPDTDEFGETTKLGAGKKYLTVFNASRTGFRLSDWMGPRFEKLKTIKPDLIILNVGLNSAADDQDKEWAEYTDGLTKIRERWSDVPIVMNLQQPMRDNDTMAKVIAVQRAVASKFKTITLIDTYTPILNAGRPKNWYADDTHLGELGEAVTLSIWIREWDNS